jgi:PPK2 family polyphosphate:nucleotide phosphotransferase
MKMTMKDAIRTFQVKPGKKFRLKAHDPAWRGRDELGELSKGDLKERAREILDRNVDELAEAQDLLAANDVYSVLIVLQAMDAAGKDGVIKHVMSGLNPQGCQVFAFKRPSDEDLDHNFLWRYSKALPERGRMGIFNRSYYEEVLVVRVHPTVLGRQRLPPGKRNDRFWDERYDDINRFEKHLTRNGTRILKFFLNVSKEEQGKRFLERLDTPEKHWKFSEADLHERKFWDEYQRAFEEMLAGTSTKAAPWWVIPADNKWVTRALVSSIITNEIRSLGLQPPPLDDERKQRLAEARRLLVADMPGHAAKVGAAEKARKAEKDGKAEKAGKAKA